jgi:predicted hydrolase (HD superfamily)
MIPDDTAIKSLWDTHGLPDYKRTHVTLVAKVAVFLAKKVTEATDAHINIPLLYAAAMLHDIDKSVPKLPNEHHPDAGVRVLREAGYDEVADIVKTHPLHAILDQTISPKTWEERLLYLADKMVKLSIITVDERFALWRAEQLPPKAIEQLDRSYPKVKALEKEVFDLIHCVPGDAARLA